MEFDFSLLEKREQEIISKRGVSKYTNKNNIIRNSKEISYLKQTYTINSILNDVVKFVNDPIVNSLPRAIIEQIFGIRMETLRKLAINLTTNSRLKEELMGIYNTNKNNIETDIDTYNKLLIKKRGNFISITPLEYNGINDISYRYSLHKNINSRLWMKLFPYLNGFKLTDELSPSTIITTVTNIKDTIVYHSSDGYVKRIPNVIDNAHPIFDKLLKDNIDNDILNKLKNGGGIISFKLVNKLPQGKSIRNTILSNTKYMLNKYNIPIEKKREIIDKTEYCNSISGIISPILKNDITYYNIYMEVEIILMEDLMGRGTVGRIDTGIFSLGEPTLPLEYNIENFGNKNITPVVYTDSGDKFYTIIANEIIEIPKVNFANGTPYCLIPKYQGGSIRYTRIDYDNFEDVGIFKDINKAKEYVSGIIIEKKDQQLKLKGLEMKEKQLTYNELKQQIDLAKSEISLLLQTKKLELEEKGYKDKILELNRKLADSDANLIENVGSGISIGSNITKNISGIIKDIFTIKSMLIV